jgi:integrase
MPKDTRYLKRDKKSGIYIFQKRVSDSVAGLLGMKNNIYNKSLGTDSLREAQGLRHSHLAYLKKLEDAESVNPSYQSVMDKYKLMDHGRLEHEFGVLSDELTTTYSHLGNPEWEDLSEQEKNAIGAPVSITEKDDIEYRVLASLTGRDPDFKPPEKYRLRLKDALNKHLEEITDLERKTIGKYKNSVRVFLAYLGLDDVLVFKIERLTVRNFIKHCKSQDIDGKELYADATVSNMLSNLGGVWDYARDVENLTAANPFRGHRITKKASKKKRGRQSFYDPWAPEDLNKVIAQLKKGTHGDLDALPVYIAWYTGARLNEAYGVKPEDIRKCPTSNIPFISFKEEFDGKTEAITREVPIHPELEKLLKDFTGFPRSSHGAYGTAFGRAKREIGFNTRKLAFHSIRRNATTSLDQAGADGHIMNQVIGHKATQGGIQFGQAYYSGGSGFPRLYKAVKTIPKL